MSARYETREIIRSEYTVAAVEVTCDACGMDALYSAHRRAHAVLSRVRDDGQSNMEIWDLDLCKACKDAVVALLKGIAAGHGRELPEHATEDRRC